MIYMSKEQFWDYLLKRQFSEWNSEKMKSLNQLKHQNLEELV